MSCEYIYFAALETKSKQKSRYFLSNQMPLFLLGKLIGVLPVSELSNMEFHWLSISIVINISAIISAAVLTVYNFYGLLSSPMKSPDQARDIFLHLSSPIFYLSTFLTSLSCFYLGRRLPQLAEKYDQAMSCLQKYSSTNNKKSYATYFVVGAIYAANISHYFGRLVVNGCLPFANKDYDLKAILFIHLKGCVPYLEPLVGSTTFGAVAGFMCSMWINLLWNLRDAIFLSFSLELRSYFKILADHVTHCKTKLEWKTIREDHRKLCHLVTLTDDAISVLIFQSYASNVYHICLDFYNALHPQRYAIISSPFRLFTLGYFLTRTIVVTLAADSVHQMAQKPMEKLLFCSSTEYTTEIQRFLTQIAEGQTYFTACQLFAIKRHLILTIFSVIVTYELVVLGI